MKIYTIMCNYILDGTSVNIELSKVLKRLNIKPKKIIYEGIEYGIDYRVTEVVKYNVDNAYKVIYCIGMKQAVEEDMIFEYYKITKEVVNFVNYLNDEQDRLVSRMSDEEFKLKYKNYGNNYLEQIKRRIRK